MLPMDFTGVLEAFAHPEGLRAWDAVGGRLNHKWIEDQPVEREPIKAVVLALDPRRLKFAPEGEASHADISIITDAELHFSDSTSRGLESRQSYVDYKGHRYRVTAVCLTKGNANLNIYHARRFFP